MFRALLVLLCAVLASLPAHAIDGSVKQLVVSVAPTWDSSTGKLQLFERDGKGWRAASQPIRVLYGLLYSGRVGSSIQASRSVMVWKGACGDRPEESSTLV